MKFNIKSSPLSQRATKRFKWMCLGSLLVVAFSSVKDYGLTSLEQFQFVDAGEDLTFEEDDIYASYVESAKI